MLVAGFLYIMSNPAYTRLKIGKSDHDPVRRTVELNSTGVPEPFVLEYSARVDDHHRAERFVHSALREVRPNRSREFFNVTVPEAIALIRESCSVLEEDIRYKSPGEIRRAEAERKLRQMEVDERERRVRERQEKIFGWVSNTNKKADVCRSRYLRKRSDSAQLVMGGLAFLGVASTIDYSWWAVAGVLIAAWFIYSQWLDSIASDARIKYPHVSSVDYIDQSERPEQPNTHIRCRGCQVTLAVPAGKRLNVTCPRCGTSWRERT